ncbi:MAG TPA: hypothetical protein VJ816_12555 [Gemmatimonadales bacterium]|nr:hypothetical protein [Gemmatimonadales bacterium]
MLAALLDCRIITKRLSGATSYWGRFLAARKPATEKSGRGSPDRKVGPGLARGERDAEVRHQRPSVVQQDVLGFDVPVNHAVAVRIVERARDLRRDPDRVTDGELLLAIEPVAERLALDKGMT